MKEAVNVDFPDLIKKAKQLHKQKGTAYLAKSLKCNKKYKGTYTKKLTEFVATYNEYLEILKTMPQAVLVCPGECVNTNIEGILAQLQKLNKKMLKQASYAQHEAIKQCKTKLIPIAQTIVLSNELKGQITKCKDKANVCNKK